MRAGELNSAVSLYRPERTNDAETNESVIAWVKAYSDIPAKREDASGGFTIRGEQVNETVDAVIYVPYIPELEVTWEVKTSSGGVGGCGIGAAKRFSIFAALMPDNREPFIKLLCSRVDDG